MAVDARARLSKLRQPVRRLEPTRITMLLVIACPSRHTDYSGEPLPLLRACSGSAAPKRVDVPQVRQKASIAATSGSSSGLPRRGQVRPGDYPGVFLILLRANET